MRSTREILLLRLGAQQKCWENIGLPSEETRVTLVEITKKIRSRHDVEP